MLRATDAVWAKGCSDVPCATGTAAREILRSWAPGQHQLHQHDAQSGLSRSLGLDDQAHATVLALVALDDDERPDGCTDDCDGADMCTGGRKQVWLRR
ncbi:hypothetical protein ACFYYS_17685 [Streptomyces sp. NPDC002120]|uniref:hypothetical protein n=1 Tax=Streptomyces sp. NPDC002120 TaxID=3364631 RepID=UPI0036A82E10